MQSENDKLGKNIASRIQTLQVRLDEQNNTRDQMDKTFNNSQANSSGRRPSNCKFNYLHYNQSIERVKIN